MSKAINILQAAMQRAMAGRPKVPLSPPSKAANPASWIWRPSFERQRDCNPPERRALSAHFRMADKRGVIALGSAL